MLTLDVLLSRHECGLQNVEKKNNIIVTLPYRFTFRVWNTYVADTEPGKYTRGRKLVICTDFAIPNSCDGQSMASRSNERNCQKWTVQG